MTDGGLKIVKRFQNNDHLRLINDWKAEGTFFQTYPPQITISEQYKENVHPIGEIQEYHQDENRKRITGPEYREKERIFYMDYECIRKSAEAHRQVRKYAQSIIKPGIKLIDLCN